jgi:S-adenosyl-L-methionine hydrolase (adenosine-forming)
MLITLTTDFGCSDSFVGIMKGVIYGINPQVTIVDLTHGVPAQDVLAGALILRHSVAYFPPGTIHVAVVDPGVGSARKPLLIEAGGSFFIGPDNGIWSLTVEEKSPNRMIHLSNINYFLKPTSATFHGRDIFAPMAAHLSLGIAPTSLGMAVDGFKRIQVPGVKSAAEEILGEIIYIDAFGNLFTNIRDHDLKDLPREKLSVQVQEVTVSGVALNYAAVAAGAWVALLNSWGLLEVAVNRDNAQRQIGAKVGDRIRVVLPGQ